MRKKWVRYGPLILALVLGILCSCVLMMYVKPMEDVILDLSLMPQEDSLDAPPETDTGWTVYTQEGSVKTELTPNGFGGYTGLELGQTFYLSRVMEEELDSPTLQIGTVERQFSVWLDDVLIYTDCPDLDNRIGYVQLPMSEWFREDPITINLPADYHGRTLTIAQSFPEWTETGSVTAWPADVRLYCGYAYESSLISETFRTTLLAAAAFVLTLLLLTAFVRNQDWRILCLTMVSFLQAVQTLMGTSYYDRYFPSPSNSVTAVLPMISTLALLCYLTLQGGKHRKLLWIPIGGCTLAVAANAMILAVSSGFLTEETRIHTIISHLPPWFAFVSLVALLVMGVIQWRKDRYFYRFFIPLAIAGIAVSWGIQIFFVHRGFVWDQILLNLLSGQIDYIYQHTLTGITVAALLACAHEAIWMELKRLEEQRLMEQQQELAMASFENLRRQHEEVMMLRHDMLRHLHALHDMGSEEKRTAYLEELIGRNQKIRPVVQSGNEMLDIILNGKLGAAADAGIRVELPRIECPAVLPLSAPDLCALLMNIMDNAISAAAQANTRQRYVRLNIHEKQGHLAISCENSADTPAVAAEAKKETVPKHGLGLKIIQGIVAKYAGAMIIESEDDRFILQIVLPLV